MRADEVMEMMKAFALEIIGECCRPKQEALLWQSKAQSEPGGREEQLEGPTYARSSSDVNNETNYYNQHSA